MTKSRVMCIRQHWGGCSDGGWAVPGTSRCRNHMYESGWSKATIKHPERAAAYKDPRWKEMRDRQLRKSSTCEVGFPGCLGKASEVDHITPVALGGDFFGPLRSVCRPCHQRLTQEASKEGNRRRKNG